tara:strand:+ start:43 stop:354 length:312 start_codon:yes stop_codon:yes gene_type:complete
MTDTYTTEEINRQLGFYEMMLNKSQKELEDFTTLLLQKHYEDYNKQVEEFKWGGLPTFGYTNESSTRVLSDKQTLSWMKQGIKFNEEKIKYFTFLDFFNNHYN